MNFRDRLKKGIILLDGAFGTMLQAKGLGLGECPETYNILKPETVADIHRAYLEAGSDVIYANTFGANERKLPEGYDVESVIGSGIRIARSVADEYNNRYVALDIGPTGALIEPLGDLSFEGAYHIFRRMVEAALKVDGGVDLVVIETMTSLNEMRAAILAVKECSDLPVICTMSFEENMRTFTGCDVRSMAVTLEGLGVDAIGINCSLGPSEILPIAKELLKWTSLPVVVKANAGLPSAEDNNYLVDSKSFAKVYEEYLKSGITIIGGCCGTTPEYIKELDNIRRGIKHTSRQVLPYSKVCSSEKCVVIDSVKVIGERINPTGKKRFKEALMNNDLDYIISQALEQKEAGADILDVNVGLPGIDERRMMKSVVAALQNAVDLPLMIDSSDPAAIEDALRIYSGKAIVNSVNGDDEVLDRILPLVKKYGAMVIGLTLDRNGIPENVEGRLKIADKIIRRAEQYGIGKENIIIDCLTLTVSAEQEQAVNTLEAIRRVREIYGVNTTLGISNISFGLPMREFVNSSFLTLAMGAGLTMPILNPNVEGMMAAVRAYRVLSGDDKNAGEYVKTYAGYTKADTQNKSIQKPAEVKVETPQNNTITIGYAILKGLKEETRKLTCELLHDKKMNPLDVIDGYLIPALDEVGKEYESGKIFLPQLIMSAETAKVGFEEVKKAISSDNVSTDKGTIILATVEGDVHDIGKNIVKVVLENYGYNIIDLGKSVKKEDVVRKAKELNVKLVGLSALMTTTLVSMEKTIAALRSEIPGIKIMVGGAVLTEEYALKIGADYYCKDANESVRRAREVFQDAE